MDEHQIQSPPRKRLLTNPNPNQTPPLLPPPSPESSSLSSDSSKKTRDLPNLSDCHSCGLHINHTNPKDRLQPLESLWRVVLLCKHCIKLIHNSDTCSYCFNNIFDVNNCVKCRECERSVHRECALGLGLGLGFGEGECVDCWVPDALMRSFRVGRRKSRRGSEESEEVKRKVVLAVKASENATRKASVAKSTVELAKGVLKVVDDVKLAFMLHRAINSSPRIGKYGCLVSREEGEEVMCYSRKRDRKKSVGVGVFMNVNVNVDVDVDVNEPLVCYERRRGKGGMKAMKVPWMCYSRRRSGSRGCLHDVGCECLMCIVRESIDKRDADLKVSNCGSNSDNSLNDECIEIDGGRTDLKSDRYVLKYQRIGKGIPRPSVLVRDSDCGSCMDFDNLNTEDTSDARDFGNGNECHERIDEGDDNTDRYLLKYKRLKSRAGVSCKFEDFSSLLPSNQHMESAISSDLRPQSSS